MMITNPEEKPPMSPELSLKEIPSSAYETLYALMKRDFPAAGELAPFFAIKRNLDKGVYTGYFLTSGAENESADTGAPPDAELGYMLLTAPHGMDSALINYFAIYPAYRAQGYGSEFLKIVLSRYPNRVFVLEAEDPAAQKTDILRDAAQRRIKFYERAGFSVLPTAKARIFGADMLIMAGAREKKACGNISARETMRALYLPAFGSKRWLRFIDVRDSI